jgi:hypothetical protein
MLATQTGAFCRTFGLRGTVVQFRANASSIAFSLAAALALCGCANVDVENKDAWFAKPFQFVSRNGGYTFSELQESRDRARPITANELVDNNGACPLPAPTPATPAVPNQAAGAPPATAAVPNQAAGAPPAADANSLLGGGVALGMSECDVVARAGAPNNVQIGKSPNGDRTAVLTIDGGPRPGVYSFIGGRLAEIDRGQTAPAAPQTAKKKTAPSAKPSKQAASQ